MGEYQETKADYEKGVDWHAEKSLTHSFSKQMKQFIEGLKGKKVLDAGCGAGRDISEFQKHGISADGLDFSRELLRKAKILFPNTNFYEADFRNTELPSDSYDGIWACAAILNLRKSEVNNALTEFNRILKPGGELFVSVKQGEGEKMISDQAGKRFFAFYTVSELREKIHSAGFIVTRSNVVSDEEVIVNGYIPKKQTWICIFARSDKTIND